MLGRQRGRAGRGRRPCGRGPARSAVADLQLLDVLGEVAAGHALVDVLVAGEGGELLDAGLHVVAGDPLPRLDRVEVDRRRPPPRRPRSPRRARRRRGRPGPGARRATAGARGRPCARATRAPPAPGWRTGWPARSGHGSVGSSRSPALFKWRVGGTDDAPTCRGRVRSGCGEGLADGRSLRASPLRSGRSTCCGRCGHEFCSTCLVYSFGPKKPPVLPPVRGRGRRRASTAPATRAAVPEGAEAARRGRGPKRTPAGRTAPVRRRVDMHWFDELRPPRRLSD